MKSKIFATVCAGLAITVSSISTTAVAAPDKLRYVGTWSSINLYRDFERPFWESDQVFPGADVGISVTAFDQMGLNGSEIFRMLSQGMFDVGTTMGAYAIGSAPELEGIDLPMLVSTPEASREVVEAHRSVLQEIFSKRFRDAELLAVTRFPQQAIFCNFPIKRLQDLQGKRIRVPGGSSAEFVQELGASPINMPFSEVTAALERRTLDCATTGVLSAYSVGWHDVTSHFLSAPVGGWGYTLTLMNGRVWNSLSEAEQQALKASVAEHFEEPALKAAEDDFETGIDCLTGRAECPHGESGKMIMSPLHPDDIELSNTILKETIIPNWASRVSKEDLDAWNKTVGEYTGLKYEGK